MPRYKFSWDNVPDFIVGALADGLGLVEDPRQELRAWFGARPKADFVEVAWPTLLESWLANDADARGEIVAQLSERGLGDTSLLGNPAGAASQMAYLHSCRNAATLRTVVVTEFHTLGEPDQIGGSGARPSRPETDEDAPRSHPAATSEEDLVFTPASPAALKGWVLQTLARAFEREVESDDDGDIPIWRGSALSYVRVDKEEPVITVFSWVVGGMTKNPAIFEAVNEINKQLVFPKAYVAEDGSAVIIEACIPADSISMSGLMHLLDNVTYAADYFDTRLVERFGGRTAGSDESAEAIDV